MPVSPGCHRLRSYPLRSRSVRLRLPLQVSQVAAGLSIAPARFPKYAAHPWWCVKTPHTRGTGLSRQSRISRPIAFRESQSGRCQSAEFHSVALRLHRPLRLFSGQQQTAAPNAAFTSAAPLPARSCVVLPWGWKPGAGPAVVPVLHGPFEGSATTHLAYPDTGRQGSVRGIPSRRAVTWSGMR